jgi:exosortase
VTVSFSPEALSPSLTLGEGETVAEAIVFALGFVSGEGFCTMVSALRYLQEKVRLNSETCLERRRFVFYGVWFALSLAVFWKQCAELFRFSLANDNASHVILIPFISAWLIYIKRKQIFRLVSFDYPLAGVLFAIFAVIYVWTRRSAAHWTQAGALAGYALAMVLVWLTGFVLFWGRQAFKNGRFPLLFLFLTIPFPVALLNRSIYFLQKGSTDIAEMIFDLAGVPALREGFVFHLAHFNIEVAKECSGIRSSLALLILALVAGHLFLRTLWKQVFFVIAGLLIMVVKNGVRIATLTILAEYVDPSFLLGRLHHKGGVVFFLLGLLLLLPLLWFLQRGEKPVESINVSPAADLDPRKDAL